MYIHINKYVVIKDDFEIILILCKESFCLDLTCHIEVAINALSVCKKLQLYARS